MNDELKAGPELDARIATEVMGWRDVTMGWVGGETDGRKWESLKSTWHPSTNIADAWRVVEKIAGDFSLFRGCDGTWICFASPDPDRFSEAPTACLAICAEALRWHVRYPKLELLPAEDPDA